MPTAPVGWFRQLLWADQPLVGVALGFGPERFPLPERASLEEVDARVTSGAFASPQPLIGSSAPC
jgi:hypothetical protein